MKRILRPAPHNPTVRCVRTSRSHVRWQRSFGHRFQWWHDVGHVDRRHVERSSQFCHGIGDVGLRHRARLSEQPDCRFDVVRQVNPNPMTHSLRTPHPHNRNQWPAIIGNHKQKPTGFVHPIRLLNYDCLSLPRLASHHPNVVE